MGTLKARPALSLSNRASLEAPKPLCRDGFLSLNECAKIIQELEFALWRPSLAFERQTDGRYRNVFNKSFRVSLTAFDYWFSDDLKAMLGDIERRLQSILPFDRAYLEDWQATSYPTRGHVNYHHDSGYWEGYFAGDRQFTFLIYLTTPARGGGTHFRALDTDIQGNAGRLIAWHNLFLDQQVDHRMIHSGVPLLEGEKTTLVTWLRQKPYRTIQSLPME